jgi:hypothetical protein
MEKPSAFDGIQKKKKKSLVPLVHYFAVLLVVVAIGRLFPSTIYFFFRYSSLFFSSLFTQRVH